MKKYGKRIISFMLMFLICAVTVLGNVNVVKATEAIEETAEEEEDGVTVLRHHVGVATGGEEELIPFTAGANDGIVVMWFVTSPCEATLGVVDSSNNWYEDSNAMYAVKLDYSDWVYDLEDDVYGYVMYTELPVPEGDYYIALESDISIDYGVAVVALDAVPSLSQTNLTMSVGAKQKLVVDNTDETITWKSSKKNVVKVNKNGVLKAKKEGTASITATTESGLVLKCKVTVKANKYTEAKLVAEDLSWEEEAVVQVYEGYYDSKGNLIAKCRFINNSGYKVIELETVELKVAGVDDKLIGSSMITSKKLELANGEVVDFTMTIQKSNLKNKKADLRNGKFVIYCDYIIEY